MSARIEHIQGIEEARIFFSWTAHLSLNLTIGILWRWRGNSLAFYFRNTFKAPNKSKLKREGLLLLLNGGNVMRRLLSGSPSHGQNGLKRGPPSIGWRADTHRLRRSTHKAIGCNDYANTTLLDERTELLQSNCLQPGAQHWRITVHLQFISRIADRVRGDVRISLTSHTSLWVCFHAGFRSLHGQSLPFHLPAVMYSYIDFGQGCHSLDKIVCLAKKEALL